MTFKTGCNLTVILGVFTLLTSLAAQTANNGEQQVRVTDDRRAEALRHGDVAPLRQIYADDYTLVTAAGVVRTKADQIREIESGELRFDKFEITERTVRIYGDVAIVLSRDKSSIVLNGRQVGGDLRVTRVYKLFGTDWKVIATHATPIAP
jgi:ketosteroid isomerase-like protein